MKPRFVALVVFVVVFVVVMVGTWAGTTAYLVRQAHQQQHRRVANCISRRELYDGDVYLGATLSTQEQHALWHILGPRPEC